MLDKPYYEVEWVSIYFGNEVWNNIKYAGMERLSETEILIYGGISKYET